MQVKNEVVRSADRVHYLKNPDEIGNGLRLGNLALRVLRWTTDGSIRSGNPITLSLEASPFDFAQALNPEQARAIAGALLAAAEEAEAAEVRE